MTDPIALFDKNAIAEWPEGTKPTINKVRRGKSGYKPKKVTKPKVDPTTSDLAGLLYLMSVTTPDGQVFYKLGITTTGTTRRFSKTNMAVELIIQVPFRRCKHAFEWEQKLLTEYEPYRGKFPQQFRFKGYTECLLISGPMLDQLITKLTLLKHRTI